MNLTGHFQARGRILGRFLVCICFIFFSAVTCIAEDSLKAAVVQGIGYPPIKAENASQARLMARRAAVVDAYRNSLAGSMAEAPGSDYQYEELSGFVSGMKIIQEEYLKDGGIRITAAVPKGRVQSPAESEMAGSGLRRSPRAVSLDEWYSIIRNLVRFENNIYGGRHE